MGVGSGVAVGEGVGVGVGVGTGVAVAVGVAVGSTGVGARVGVGLDGIGVDARSGCLMVRAKMLKESTRDWAVEAVKSTVVGSASHSSAVSSKCWITTLDSAPPARDRSPVLRRMVIVIGLSKKTEVSALPASGTNDRSNTF